MKKIITTVLLAFILFVIYSQPTYAAISQDELDQYLTQIGWTNEDLQDYLEYFEMSLEDYATIDELRAELGTPLTEENLAELLTTYGMSKDELNELLAGFGESVEDYLIYEELDASIDFYLNNEDYMLEAEDFLATVGLTEEEVDQLFTHFMALDETELEIRMEEIAAKLEPYATMDPDAELTEAQMNELAAAWAEIMSLLQLNPSYYLVNANGVATPVSFQDLMAMEDDLGGKSLVVELYDKAGNLLLDMQLSEDMLSSNYIFETANELVDVGDLAGELTIVKHDTLPNTASPYGLNMLLGLLTMFFGVFVLRKTRNRELV